MICAKNAAVDSVAATCGLVGTRTTTITIIITRMSMAITVTAMNTRIARRRPRSSWT